MLNDSNQNQVYGEPRTLTAERPPATRPSSRAVAAEATRPELPAVDLRRFRLLTRGPGEAAAPISGALPSIYPFTKSQQLINDGVGFGEQVTECRVPTGPWVGTAEPKVLSFRRTRSGKVPITETGAPFFLKNGLKGRGS